MKTAPNAGIGNGDLGRSSQLGGSGLGCLGDVVCTIPSRRKSATGYLEP